MSLGDYLDLQASETILFLPHYFIGGMMPKPSNPLQQSTRVIEIRPYRDGEDGHPQHARRACATGASDSKRVLRRLDAQSFDALKLIVRPFFELVEIRSLQRHKIRRNRRQ